MEPVYRALEIAARTVVRGTGTRITYRGLENIPAVGGAVIAINHTGYVDFLPAALGVMHRKRRLRFMIKAELQEVAIVDYLIKHTKAIPVDRSAGADAYAVAVERLRAGRVVAVYPEATISRSFELKDFKTGAARMALEAQVPIVPLIVWGSQRMWTKGHPKNLGRKKIPVTVAVGPPLAPSGNADALMAELRAEMTTLLNSVRQGYPHPRGEYWVPRSLGGGAPTLAEAKVLDEDELAERARHRTEGG